MKNKTEKKMIRGFKKRNKNGERLSSGFEIFKYFEEAVIAWKKFNNFMGIGIKDKRILRRERKLNNEN